MSGRGASLLAWSLAFTSVVVFMAGLPLLVLARSANVPSSWGADLSAVGFLGEAFFLIFPLVGALIAARRPRNPIGWLLLMAGLFWLLSGTMDYYAVYGVASPGSVPFPLGVAGINNWLWVPFVGLLGTFVFLLFPDGRLPSSGWRPLALFSGVVIVLVCVLVGLTPEPMQDLGGKYNPFGVEAFFLVEIAPYILVPLLLSCMVLSVLSLVLRYRRSRGEERQQVKWIAYAASLVGALYLTAMVGSFAYPQESWFAPGSPVWQVSLEYAALLSFTLIPTAIGFAVLRYRLYDIDLLINRTLVYGLLTVMLLLVYFGGVTATQAVFRSLTGQEQQPQFAVVVSTLAIAALFNPLRHRIQTLIDRRFYRRKYDAARLLEDFGARLRDQTDLDGLGEDLVKVVRDAMQPEHVSLWLRWPGWRKP
jgi:hypothetical protein